MYSAKPRRSKPVGWIRGILGGVVNSCRAFCLQTSIHGFNHIAAPRRHWLERLVWLCVTATAVWGTVDVSLGQWQRYQDNPTVVTLDKDFRTWTYTMPGVTACKPNRTSIEKLEKAIKLRWKVSPGHPKYSYYLRFVDVVANSDLYHLDGYREFANDSDLNVDLYQLAVEVMPDQRVKLMAAEQISSTAPRWTPVMTEVGACYTINSLASAEIAILKPGWNSTQDLPVTCQYSSQGCYFIFEYPDDNMSVHSTGICQQGCKSRVAVKLCGCKPFYYHFAEGPPCSPAGMRCLAGIAHRLPTFDNTKCSCVQPCLDSLFREISTGMKIWLLRVSCLLPSNSPWTCWCVKSESRDDVKSGQFAVHGAAAPHAVHKENRVPLPGPGCVVRRRSGTVPGRQLHQLRGGRLLPRRTHPMHRRKEDGIQ